MAIAQNSSSLHGQVTRYTELKFYNEEEYLLEEVGPPFRESGIIDPADFFMILVWKAARAKNKHKKRLTQKSTFQAAVSQIASDLYTTPEEEKRLQILMEKWGFRLPTATAILTILYPDEFTVYDVRACNEVGQLYKPSRSFSHKLWVDYESFRANVISEAPSDLSLRDKDRFLVGRSFRKDVEKAIAEKPGG